MRKNKTGPVKDKEKTGLTQQEQAVVNKEFEKAQGTKLPNGENAAISEASYADWKKTGRVNYTYYNPAPKRERVDVGTLKTRGIPKANTAASLQKSKKYATTSKVEDKKFKPDPGTKRLTKGGNTVIGSNLATTVKNKVNEAKFNKQKQQSKASDRALKGEGVMSNKVAALQEQKRSIKQVKREGLVSKSAARAGIKDARSGIKYEKKLSKGKAIYKK